MDAYSKITSGRVATTAGTPVQLSETSINCKKISLSSKVAGNSGVVVFGDSEIVASESTRKGQELFSGDTTSIEIDNVSKIFVDSVETGQVLLFNIYS